jgi:hypothetical protein
VEYDTDEQVTLDSITAGHIDSLSLSKVTVSDTLVNNWRIAASGTSQVTLSNSNIDYAYAYSQSNLIIEDSTVRYLYVYDYSDVSLTDSIVTGGVYLEFQQASNLDLTGLRPGVITSWDLANSVGVFHSDIDLMVQNSEVARWYIYVYGDSVVSLSDSELGYVYAYGDSVVSIADSTADGVYGYSESNVMITGCELRYIGVYDYSNLTISDSFVQYTCYLEFDYDSNIEGSLPTETVTSWNLFQDMTVTKAFVNCTIKNTVINQWSVTVTGTSQVTLSNSNIDYAYAYSQSNLIIKDSTVRYLYVYDYSDVSLTDSIVTGGVYLEFETDSDLGLTGLRPGAIASWNVADSGVASCNFKVQNSEVAHWYIYVYGDSVVSLSDSELEYVYAYGDSVVSFFSSIAQGMYCYGFSETTLQDSTVNYLYVYDSSQVTLTDSTVQSVISLEFEYDSELNTALPSGSISQWDLETITTRSRIKLKLTNSQLNGKWRIYCRHIAEVAISNSQLDYVYPYDYASLSIKDSPLNGAYAYGVSNLMIRNTILDGTLSSYETSHVQMLDSSVNQLRSYKTSSIVLQNCTSYQTTAYDLSAIQIGWYLLLTVKDADTGPLSGVTVEILDNERVLLQELSTDSQGTTQGILWEKTILPNDVFPHGTYIIRIMKDDMVDEFTQTTIKNNVNTTFIYKHVSPVSNLFGLPGYLGIILIVVGVVAILLVFLFIRRREVPWS